MNLLSKIGRFILKLGFRSKVLLLPNTPLQFLFMSDTSTSFYEVSFHFIGPVGWESKGKNPTKWDNWKPWFYETNGFMFWYGPIVFLFKLRRNELVAYELDAM